MRSSSCLHARDWNSTKPPYWMNEGGLGLKTSARRELEGARDFQVSSAVSGFREVRKKRKAKSFFRGFGLRSTPKIPASLEKYLWYPG